MMVSATHTHSAPAAMACLGTRQDKAYAEWLPGRIAAAIIGADKNLQPARIGWAAIDDWEHTHNRRWIRNPEHLVGDPFGNATGRAHMHPGYLSNAIIGPSGPVDPSLSIVSLQTITGQPLAVLANYSQHYFGAGAVSADYYGLFCKHIASLLGQTGEGNGPFVAAISQGTSGDLMWMDYGSPAKSLSRERYAEAVARYAETALAKIEYHDFVPIGIVERNITLSYRVPDDERLQWAQPIAAKIENELPKNVTEVYALEATILHERQRTNVKLQAIRIGDLTIATLPNEVYALTGLKLRGRSPGEAHFNIELANGAEGYIPPPEQHALGGYTTWPARTAGLEVQAETKIVETLVEGLESVTGKPRRQMQDEHGPYARTILQAEPLAYYRLNDEDGSAPRNAVNSGSPAALNPGYALYLPGVGSGTGIGDHEQLVASNFSGPTQINRAIHFAGGDLSAQVDHKTNEVYSTAFWFWLGERSGASQRSGSLFIGAGGEKIIAQQGADHQVQIVGCGAISSEKWPADQWHFAVVVREGTNIRIHINGANEPALHATCDPTSEPSAKFQYGVGLQGKLDEIAVFDRGLTGDEIQTFWQASGIEQQHARDAAVQQRLAADVAARAKPLVFPDEYSQTVQSLMPLLASPLTAAPKDIDVSGNVTFDAKTFATFSAGQLAGKSLTVPASYSVSLWFRNDLASNVRPVTAYLFSRGPRDDALAPGDHLGIGGTYQGNLTGKLILFNGNASNQVLAGRTILQPQTWNHVVMVRDGVRGKLYLNGNADPEIDAPIEVTTKSSDCFFGARNDFFAPLQGNLAQIALFDRALTADEVSLLYTAAKQPQSDDDLQPKTSPGVDDLGSRTPAPESQPLSVEQSLQKIHVPRGFRVELVAAEPNVVDPVAFDWDEAGRLWVVEMSDYPLGMDGHGKAGGRVRVLEDHDGDGQYEASRVFADDLRFPNGILTWRDGVLVTAAPEILYLRDTDGDGAADQREVLFSGFNEGNQQLRMNHLRWGLDNWVYCANGGHHANHGLSTRVKSHRQGTFYDLGSRDFRFRPDSGELELESGPSQYGRNRDAWGHWFGTQNANPLWHYVLSDRYLGRNPHVPTTTPLKHLVGPGSPEVYPASAPEKRFHSFAQSGRFTSACSSMIYNDDLLFGSDALTHALTCEPFHNLVQHNVLSDFGVSFQARRPLAEGAYDFFASEDRWCRPVMVRTGPDGALWIADMYRYMIEHPDWLPPEGKAELLPHYRLGDHHGRLYRVLPTGGDARQNWKLNKATTAELVAALASSNDWRRDKAQQLLLWNADSAAIPLLKKLIETAPLPQTRLQAIWILEGLGAITEKSLLTALSDVHPRVRENALRVAESHQSREVVAAASRLADDLDAKVCLQLALTLGQWKSPLASDSLVRLASRFPSDSFLVAAVMSSALTHGPAFVEGIIAAEPEVLAAYRLPLLRQSIGAKDHASLALLLQNVMTGDDENPLELLTSLDAFLLLLQQLGTDLHQIASVHPNEPLAAEVAKVDRLLDVAQQLAAHESQPDSARLIAATVLCRSIRHRGGGIELLSNWLRPQVNPETQAQAIDVLAQTGDKRVPSVFAEAWQEFSPELRNRALQAWLSREPWTNDLLDRIESQTIPVQSLDLTQRDRLLQHPAKAIAARSKILFSTARQSTRKEVVDMYRQAFELSGQAGAGHQVFTRACANCHPRGEQGHDVGPNLATVIEHSNEKLLTNIFDPNADIQPGYQAYTCLLDSGEVLSGIIAGETANSVTIKQANGLQRTITRNEIERLQNTNLSLMPEGMETVLTAQEFADLLAFLRQPIINSASPQ
jgi:putative membrane-bound dehydrogenase-like protein